MRRLLLLVLLIVAGSASAEVDSNSSAKQLDATPTEGLKTIAPISKGYVGGTRGFGLLDGWNTDPVDYYYYTKGYSSDGASRNDVNMYEWNIYSGYRLRDFMDVELGYSKNDSDTWIKYTNYSGGNIMSSRKIKIQALYVATLLRPKSTGFGHGFYFKLGLHASQFEIEKSVTGNAANLNTIAAGDIMAGDGRNRGVGSLIGIGFDFRTGSVGALRLEANRYYGLGGTSYTKNSLNVGYQFNF